MTINDGVTTTLDAGFVWVITNNTQHHWSSGATPTGKLVNKGTIRVDMTSLWRSDQGGGTIVHNYGLIDMVRAGAQIHQDRVPSILINYTGAVFQASTVSGLRGITQNGGYINDGGTVRATNSATLEIKCGNSKRNHILGAVSRRKRHRLV